MNMIRFLTLPLLWLALALPVAADKIPLNDLSTYLNGLKSVEGSFTQINGDGSISTGAIYIKRPGRVRFEYAPPEKSLVIAGGGQVAIFDAKSNTGPKQYPLKRTPLNIILQRNVNLSRENMVVGHSARGDTTTITAQDPENPEYGSIQLVFTDNPVKLRQWVINDTGGGQTTVILDELKQDVTLSPFLFDIGYEASRWNR